MLTPAEEKRAQDVFAAEIAQTRGDWKAALHAALVDLDGRSVFTEKRGASATHPRPLLERYRAIISVVCERLQANLESSCSPGHTGHRENDARGVIVGLLIDAGWSPREIADGVGVGASVVANCRASRSRHPEWQKLIAELIERVKAS